MYTLLGRLEDKGLVASRTVEAPVGAGGPPRRLYKVTGTGARIVDAAKVAGLKVVFA